MTYAKLYTRELKVKSLNSISGEISRDKNSTLALGNKIFHLVCKIAKRNWYHYDNVLLNDAEQEIIVNFNN